MSQADAIATEVDVLNCYRVILKREPESLEVVRKTADEGLAVWDLIRSFFDSDERKSRDFTNTGHRIAHGGFSNYIDMDGTPEQIETLFQHVRQVWATYGNEEPYWSVLTGPEFRRAAMNAISEEIFYASGRDACDLFAAACRRNGVRQPTDGLVLDFGCGLGRLGEHLSQDFSRYLGVDISGPHLAMARTRMAQIGRTNCEFQLLSDFLAATPGYDAVMSLIVLQHNPPPVMLSVLNALLGRLNPGGVAFFQLPCYLFNYRFTVPEYLEMIAVTQSMEMHALPQRVVFQAISDHSCRVIEANLDGLIGDIGLSYTFFVQKTV